MKNYNLNNLSQNIRLSLVVSFVLAGKMALANGIYGNGVGAESMSMGGAEVGWAADPLGAMTANPAGLGFLTAPEVDFGGEGAILEGNFTSKEGNGGAVNSSLRALPEAAIGYPLKSVPITFGLSCVPQSGLLADWNYIDPAGGANGTTTYGYQEDKSEIILIRSAAGVAWQINSKLSIGASVGLLYNQNDLVTPYIFQNAQPSALNGAKTLLNMHTSGFGGDATAGILYRATTNLQFGAFYQSESIINTSGHATGDPYAQFGLSPGVAAFSYDAEVKNKFPQNASIGTSWQFLPKFRAAAEVDWIDWAHSFDTLNVSMSHGQNGPVPSFTDKVPLNWSSEFVYRVGLEYDVLDNLALRVGYSYGNNPVPSSTLTPMTAAVTENVISAGVGYHWSRYKIDLAYQYYVPVTVNVGQSQLLSGEYSNSSTTVSAHVLALTLGVTF